MDKLKTSAVGGFPFVLDDIRQFLGRLSGSQGIYQAFNNLLRGFGDNFIVQGAVASGSSPNVAITEGWVILDGELVKVDAQTGINTSTDNKFVKVTTFDSRGNKAFQNGSIEDTYEKNRAVVQGTTGNLDFDGDTFSDLRSISIFRDTLGVETSVIIKTKIIEIGDWNMDTTATIDVAHGLTDFNKMRTINVFIKDDPATNLFPLNRHDSSGSVHGSVDVISSSIIRILRITGGIFDSSLFDSTSFNRGFITIEFEA